MLLRNHTLENSTSQSQLCPWSDSARPLEPFWIPTTHTHTHTHTHNYRLGLPRVCGLCVFVFLFLWLLCHKRCPFSGGILLGRRILLHGGSRWNPYSWLLLVAALLSLSVGCVWGVVLVSSVVGLRESVGPHSVVPTTTTYIHRYTPKPG